ncbi:MAG: hypothetical protein ACI4OL_01315 [Gemmiger sp.]
MPRLKAFFTAAAALLLAACAPTADVNAEPVWQTTLPATGVTLAFDHAVTARVQTLSLQDEAVELDFYYCDSTPVMLLGDAGEARITVEYVAPSGDGYRLYTERPATPKLEYTEGQKEDGTLVYDFETIYNYLVTVSSDAGTDRFVLLCETPAPQS